jgi:ribonuclease BN (tRNA processing enzyme)
MELTILGASGTWPAPGGETCGMLVSHDDFHLWVDAGTGTFARLQEYIRIDQIGAVLITHGHADHFVDILPCFYARHYGGMGAPGLPLLGPPGFVDLASILVSEAGRNVMAEAFAHRSIAGGDTAELGPFAVSAFEMAHIGVAAVGFRIEAGGATLAYTGDSGPCDQLVELARDADVFVSEATSQNSMPQVAFHMSASQAAAVATEAGAKRLVLTHLLPTIDPEVSRSEAAAVFDGPVDIATCGLSLRVGG